MEDSSFKFGIIRDTSMEKSNILTISELCEIAGVSRSGYYAWRSSEQKRAARETQDAADFRQILEAYRFRGYAKGVRGIIIPATMAVYKECILRGWTTAFIDAGCIVSTPTCGPCLGGYMGILAAGERCVSTTNRNFVGRMGHVTSEIYLASPATAAASALTGYITDPRTV